MTEKVDLCVTASQDVQNAVCSDGEPCRGRRELQHAIYSSKSCLFIVYFYESFYHFRDCMVEMF